ncbi:MAG: hypothetical protein ACYC2Y_10540 [Armatimonadota bacterium]
MEKAILERLETLEKRNRRLTLAVGAMALVFLFAICFAATNPEKIVDVLRVHRLEVVDPKGEIRAIIDASDEDVVLELGSPEGEHIYMEAENDGDLAFFSLGNKKSLELYSETSKRTGLYLYDGDENRGWLGLLGDHPPTLRLLEGDNKVTMSFLGENKPYISLLNGEKTVVGLSVYKDGSGHILVADPESGDLNGLDP